MTALTASTPDTEVFGPAGRFLRAIEAAGFKPRGDATMAEAITHLAANPCEIGFVVGDCLSQENKPFLPDVTGGEPCWPCYARRVLQIVKGRQ